MRACSLAMVAVFVGLMSFFGPTSDAFAQRRHYPLVYGSTGRPYGPTQAHYQYQRQYGRPWHGYGGLTASAGISSAHFNVGGGYYPSWGGWSGGGYWSPDVVAPAPGLAFYSPGYYGNFGVGYAAPPIYLPYPNYAVAQFPPTLYPPSWSAPGMADPLAAAMQQNQLQWGDQLPAVKPDPVHRPVVPSSTEARLKSLEAQSDGDRDMQNQKWLQAYIDYKKAVQLADDRADAHLRLGLALIALRHYDTAAVELKRAVKIDPTLPRSELTLTKLFGPGSELARSSVAHKLLEYVQADIRDPDRLFLMGTLLHFDGDPHAREVLETGMRLAGGGSHFAAFLQPTADTYVPRSSAPLPSSYAQPPQPEVTPPATSPPSAPALPPAPLPEPMPSADVGPRLIVPGN
ncbi:MAG: tetratricopeptide repeat protein [Planctomycetaceae bacterium]|nr:tetratricopeptide repeat protein [Planctomycetaceae bacterium]